MPGEEPARGFLDDWQAAHLLHTPWDERVAHVFLLDPGRDPGAPQVRTAVTGRIRTASAYVPADLIRPTVTITAAADG